jgi:hypothetical protein
MPKPVFDAELPAPLSLTLDQVREVAGGLSAVTSIATLTIVPRWWWYGQPVAPYVNIGSLGSVGQQIAG